VRPLAFALLLGGASLAHAGALGQLPVDMPSPYRPMSNSGTYTNFRPVDAGLALRPMKHRWGFGFDYVPGLGLAGGTVAQPNALALRWWATDRLAVDLDGTMTSSGVSVSAATQGTLGDYGGALGLRYVVSEPSKDLLVQVLMKGGYAKAAPNTTAQTATTAGFVGLGFEAFIPGWEWVSLEGSAGANYLSQDAVSGSSTSNVGVGAGGYAPLNFSVHVYF
jgi:hypothetical protein